MPEVPSSRLMAVSRSLAARYRPAFCGDGSSANARTASANAAAAAPDDWDARRHPPSVNALAASACRLQSASISGFDAMRTDFQ